MPLGLQDRGALLGRLLALWLAQACGCALLGAPECHLPRNAEFGVRQDVRFSGRGKGGQPALMHAALRHSETAFSRCT